MEYTRVVNILGFWIYYGWKLTTVKWRPFEIFAKLNKNILALANILQLYKYQILVNMRNMSYV